MDDSTVALDSPLARDRLAALTDLVANQGVGLASPEAGEMLKINLHAHTIYSYSGYGYSPSRLAWLALRQGWYALGTVDFDVLDGVEETLTACDICGIRGAAGLETRTWMPDRLDDVFNSPGEPGVMYYVAMGFAGRQPHSTVAATLESLRERAQARNREMVRLVNAYLDPVVVDYTRDVVPLTPCGNATERHILVAYDAAARRHFPAREDLLGFWAERLGLERAAVGAFLGEDPFPHDAIRSKLMKQGGPGYMLPGPGSFPALDEIVDATQACGALPCYAFLDGTNRGEQDMASQLEYLIERGIVALVVIPERNWNVSDAGHAQELVQRLHQALDVAQAMDFPVFIGTEMNKPGQRQIDDLSVPALRAYARQFQQGADMLYAHTALARTGGLGYHSEWARAELPSRAQRARFYGEIGRHMRPADGSIARAASVMQSAGPRAALRALCQ